MSKTLETKKRILSLLKKREMTRAELSRELGLSTATISQHMEELQSMGAVEKIDNEHFRKLKYYKASETANPIVAKYIAGIIIILVIAAGSSLYLYNSGANIKNSTMPASAGHTTSISNSGPSMAIMPASVSQGFSCPAIFAGEIVTTGNITGYYGLKYYMVESVVNQPGIYAPIEEEVPDYVLAPGSSGVLTFTLNRARFGNGTQNESGLSSTQWARIANTSPFNANITLRLSHRSYKQFYESINLSNNYTATIYAVNQSGLGGNSTTTLSGYENGNYSVNVTKGSAMVFPNQTKIYFNSTVNVSLSNLPQGTTVLLLNQSYDNYTTPGIETAISPANVTISLSRSATINVSITALPSTPTGTYLLASSFNGGACGGVIEAYLTIGTEPYG